MKCPNCGAELAADQKFCNHCGFPIEKYAKKAAEKRGTDVNQPTTDSSNNVSQTTPVNNTNFQNNMNQNIGNQNVQPNTQQNQTNNGYANQNFNPNQSYNQQPNQFNNQANYANQNSYNNQNGYANQQPNNQPNRTDRFEQNYNSESNNQQFQNVQPTDSTFSFMLPFVKNNTILCAIAVILLVIVALFNLKFAGILLLIELVGWYVLADQNHDKSTSINTQLRSTFSNVTNSSTSTTPNQLQKFQWIVAAAALVGIVTLFVGAFVNISFSYPGASTHDIKKYFDGVGLGLPSYTFTGLFSAIERVMAFISAGGDLFDAVNGTPSGSTDTDGVATVKFIISLIKWIIIIAPFITLIFTFVKTKASSILRIIGSAISTIMMVLLGIGLIAAHNSSDQGANMTTNLFQFGISYYLSLIAAIVALVVSIMWLVQGSRIHSQLAYQQANSQNNQNNPQNFNPNFTQQNPSNQPNNNGQNNPVNNQMNFSNNQDQQNNNQP